jgi:hypothetical protein
MTVIDSTATNAPTTATASITRTEIVKLLAPIFLPLLITGILSLVGMYYAQQSQTRDIADTRKAISEWQVTKEERTARLAVIETTLKQQGEDLKEIRADVKTLLRRDSP